MPPHRSKRNAYAGEAFAAAGADSRTDVLGHVQWRAMRLVQGVQALLDEIGEDPVLHTALISALLSARASSTLPGSRDDAITSIRKAGQALDMAAAQARHLH